MNQGFMVPQSAAQSYGFAQGLDPKVMPCSRVVAA
jgi:hypothetical protein